MEIIYKEGNLLEQTDTPVIAHQVNCLGKMGAGLAKEIRQQWPHVYNGYRDRVKRVKAMKGRLLGTAQGIEADNKYVFNVFAQDGVGVADAPFENGRRTDYDALKSALEQVKKIMKVKGFTSVGIPYKFGCGLAGGDWNIVESIFKETFDDSDIKIFVFKLPV